MEKRLYSLTVCLVLFLLGLSAQQQLTNLPALYINTFNKVPITSKTDYIYANITYVDGDSIASYDSVSIRGRGNSTWNFAKKPYRIKFKEKTKFLGKGHAKAKSWTLLANHADKTFMRNALAAEIGRYMELPFNAAARFVDVTLNGTFLGNYQISDQVEVRKNRVEVTEQDFPLLEGADISGGYLVEVDGFGSSEPKHFWTGKNVLITVKYPDSEEINQDQVNYIKDYFQQFENALFSNDYKDPEKGYRAYVDSATLVNWYLATELTGNVDGFWSTYIYKDQGDPKLYFGPLWDYDIAFNNCNRTGEVTNALMMDKGFGTDLTKVWVKRMWGDKWFLKALNDRWEKLIDKGLKKHLLQYVDSMADELNRSQTLNYLAKSKGGAGWSINNRVYNEIMLYTTYQGYVNYLKDFVDRHIDFLTTTFASFDDDDEPLPEPDPSVPFVPDEMFFYRIFNKGTNMLLDMQNPSQGSNAGIVMWSADFDRLSQQWGAMALDGEYVQFVNRQTGMALTDVAPYGTNGYQINTQLVQLPADKTDARQAWKIIPVNTGDLYVFENKQSKLIMNNAGGGSNNGNKVISYTNDDRNTTSLNRQWIVEKFELKDFTSVDKIISPTDYAVYYNPDEQVIHFVADDLSQIDTEVVLCNMSGAPVRSFRSTETMSVADLPNGVYIIRWMEGSQMRSVKFVKQ